MCFHLSDVCLELRNLPTNSNSVPVFCSLLAVNPIWVEVVMVYRPQGTSYLGPGTFLPVKNWEYHRRQKGKMLESWLNHLLDFCTWANKLIS